MKQFLIFLKYRIYNKSYLMAVTGCCIFLCVASFITIPQTDNLRVGVCIEKITAPGDTKAPQYTGSQKEAGDASREPDFLRHVKDSFRESVFEAVIYDDTKILIEDVKKGGLECGFIFPADMDMRLEKQQLAGSILCISTPFSLKTEAAKETVNNAVIKGLGPYVMEGAARQLFGDVSLTESGGEMQELYEEYLARGLVPRLHVERLETTNNSDNTRIFDFQKNTGLRYLTGLCVFIIIILSSYQEGNAPGYFNALTIKEKRRNIVLYDLSAAVIPGALGAIYISSKNYNGSFLAETARMLLLIFMTFIWQSLIRGVRKGGVGCGSGFLLTIILNIVLCPVIMDLSDIFPVVGLLKRLLPLGWF